MKFLRLTAKISHRKPEGKAPAWETGAFLWEKLENDTTKEELLKAMLDEYEVTEDIAKKDIDNFITKLKDGNLLE